jgi:hypothetical protein
LAAKTSTKKPKKTKTMNHPTKICSHLPFAVPVEVAEVLDAAPKVIVASTTTELVELAVADAKNGWHEVSYEVPGRGLVDEARRLPRQKRDLRKLPRTLHAAARPGLHGDRRQLADGQTHLQRALRGFPLIPFAS